MKQNYVIVTLCIENAIHENEHWYTRVWENFGDNGIRA